MKQQRLGLILVAASVLAILAICGLLIDSQEIGRREQNRAQASRLGRLLASIPLDRLVPGDGAQGRPRTK